MTEETCTVGAEAPGDPFPTLIDASENKHE
jgi:hypothetical protein